MASKIARFAVYLSAAITFGALLFVIFYILINGIPALSTSLFEFDYSPQNVSMMPSIISTLYTIGGVLLVATPIGVFTGFYLV